MLRSLLVAAIVLAAASQTRAQGCPADCNDDAAVAVNELVTCVNIVLASGPTTSCPACDVDGDGTVAINELIAGVNSALSGCTEQDLPDLVPVSARFRSMTPACINDTSEIQIQLEVCIENQGTADSGPFNVEVLGEPFGRVDGLAEGAQTCLRGAFVPFAIDVEADADHEVAESDELDNFDNFFVPQPSPPPFCSPTETPTETPPVTETPTPVDTATPTPIDTETATPIDSETPTFGPTGTATATDTDTATPEPSATPTETAAPTATASPVGFCINDEDCISAFTVCAGMHCLLATVTATAIETPGP